MTERRLPVSYRIEPDVLQGGPAGSGWWPRGGQYLPAPAGIDRQAHPLRLDAATSSWFGDPRLYPPGTATLDSGFAATGLAAWRPSPARTPGSPGVTRGSPGKVVAAWTVAGLTFGCGLGGVVSLILAAPIAAAAATELILLPAEIWLWSEIHSAAFLPAVVETSAVSVGVAALGRRLPPGAGSRTARASTRGSAREERR